MQMIRVCAVVIRNDVGNVLTVRKRGTEKLMLPGGKPEPNETPIQTAMRESLEEVGAVLDEASLTMLGVFQADAANEPGFRVESTVFIHPLVEGLAPLSEIEALEWIDPEVGHPQLAPLLRNEIFPALTNG